MAPLTAEERRIAREKNQVVRGLASSPVVSRDMVTISTSQQKTTRTKKARTDTVGSSALVSRVVEPEPEFEAGATSTTFFTPVQFARDDWRSNLLVGKYEVKDGVSLWDSRFPLEEVVAHLSVPEDKKAIEDLGVEQSLDAIQSYSLWTASLAAESKRLLTGFSEQRCSYHARNLELKNKIQDLERQLQVLRDKLTRTTDKLKEAEQKMTTSTQEYHNLEKAKEDLQSSLQVVQEECESLRSRLDELQASSTDEYDNGFNSALGRVMERFPDMDLTGLRIF
jgi:myosin heavy subunit